MPNGYYTNAEMREMDAKRIAELDAENKKLDSAIIRAAVFINQMSDAADKMLYAISTMAIDGWLDGEYDLPDQQDLVAAAREYSDFKKNMRTEKEKEVDNGGKD